MRVALIAGLLGFLLRFVVGLHPVAWMAWVVPAFLLVFAFAGEGRDWRPGVMAACVIGYQVNAAYYFSVMSLAGGVAVMLGQSLLWLFVVSETRRAVRRWSRGWTALAYPVLWVAVDTLLATWFPEGNFGSLAYSQADVLPFMQTASLFGVAGVLFLLCLLPSAAAVLWHVGWRDRSCQAMLAVAIITASAAVAFGTLRLRQADTGSPVSVGLAAVDDAIGLEARAPYIRGIQAAYDEHVRALARAGARVVVLPEKIAVVKDEDAGAWASWLAAAAAREHVWLLGGVARSTATGIVNEAWLYDADGRPDATYQKQILAPPERATYVAGQTCVVRDVDGVRTGIAICKDLHFATMGRAYGQLDAGLMLVPAWDFGRDSWMAARMTAVRGIENGYAVARSAREGRLTLTDAYGRILDETASAVLPGARVVATLRTGPRIATLYTSIGNALGWLCVAASACLVWSTRRPWPQSAGPTV